MSQSKSAGDALLSDVLFLTEFYDMCGIAGATRTNAKVLKAALETMRHRGPDADGMWFNQMGIGLGHDRLAIIDLDAKANQPMVCARTGNVIAFNGEIYNFRALRRDLERLGWTFETQSDTEVLLAAYGEWGKDCLKRVNGMFAFSIFDHRRTEIFLARDRVGKKPLYYTLHDGQLAWASEIKGVLQLGPRLPRRLDYEALKSYIDIGYIPGAHTIYRDIRKVPPAHYATYGIAAKTFHEYRYWQLPEPDRAVINEDEAAEELDALLKDAVKIRLEADVPVGTFLSGGLDSSLVVAITAGHNPDVVAYTAKFPIAQYDESNIAARVAQWVGIRHEIVPVDADDRDALIHLAWQYDEPFDDSSLLPTYLVSRALRRHVKVALSGDGGDELFAGYDFYERSVRETRLQTIPRWLRIGLSLMHHAFPEGLRGKGFLRRLPNDGVERFLSYAAAPDSLVENILAPEIKARLTGLSKDGYRHNLLRKFLNDSSGRSMTLLDLMTRLDFFCYLPDDILVKVDRASMLASLEVRSPLLDYRIAELAYRLPDHLRLNGVTRKYLLKKVARKYLPPDFPFDRKQGFGIPEHDWFRDSWRDMLTSSVKQSALLDARKVAKLQRMHDRNPRLGRILFKALMLSEFERNWGDGIER